MAFLYPWAAVSRKTSRSSRRLLFLVVLLATSSFFAVGASFRFGGPMFQMPKEDPYKVLEVPRKDHNNMDAIKRAYREKARKAHPDKNPNLDPEIANRNFHRINSAYEYLSNKDQKRWYDQRKDNQQQQYRRQKEQEERRQAQRRRQAREQQRQARERERRQREEEKRRQREITKLAREAQANILQLTKLEDLIHHKVVDSATMTFQKNFMCVFVSNKKIENMAENQYLFPYPFGPKGRNDVDWGSLIQMAKVRFNKATPLTQAFKVPKKLSEPYIVFVEKGSPLEQPRFVVYQPPRQHTYEIFEQWVMAQLQTKVNIINRNPQGGPSIKVWFAEEGQGSTTILKAAGKSIAPGYMLDVPVKISDRLVIMDATTNEFIGSSAIKNSNIWQWDEDIVEKVAMDDVVVTEKGQTINIGAGHGTTRTCYDMTNQCKVWLLQDENICETVSAFSHSMCAKSCGVCIESPYFNGLHYLLIHSPIHKIPKGWPLKAFLGLRTAAKFLVMVLDDFLHLWTMRRTVMAACLVGGLLMGIQIDLLVRMMLEQSPRATSITSSNAKGHPSLLALGFWFFTSGLLAFFLLYVYQSTTTAELFYQQGLINFHWDLKNLCNHSSEIGAIFFGIGAASQVVCKVLTYPLFRRQGLNLFGRAVFLASAVVVSFLMVVGLTIHFGAQKSSRTYILNIKWERALKLFKNVGATIVILGHLVANTVLKLLQYLKCCLSTRKNSHLFASLVNLSAGCTLLALALQDPYFLQDFDHVTSMRMSAAIPCMVAGMFSGIFGAFQFDRIFASRKKRSTTRSNHGDPAEFTKQKVD